MNTVSGEASRIVPPRLGETSLYRSRCIVACTKVVPAGVRVRGYIGFFGVSKNNSNVRRLNVTTQRPLRRRTRPLRARRNTLFVHASCRHAYWTTIMLLVPGEDAARPVELNIARHRRPITVVTRVVHCVRIVTVSQRDTATGCCLRPDMRFLPGTTARAY